MRRFEFESLLIDDLAWRKKEISNLILIGKDNENIVIAKSLILLLYAHWEGYVKNSSELYLSFVGRKNLKIDSLTNNFKAITLKTIINDCFTSNESISLKKEISVLVKLSKTDKTKFKFNRNAEELSTERDSKLRENLINTHSNLNIKGFKNLLEILGIQYKSQFEPKEKYIELYLLKTRNMIAHGNKIESESGDEFNLTIKDIEKLRDIVFIILDNLKDELLEFTREEYFLEKNKDKAKEFHEMKCEEIEASFKLTDSKYE